MRFSIIMPSYLGMYKNAAKNRELKILRAIDSVETQRFSDWELIIVADGCEKTIEIVEPIVSDNIRLLHIPKQKLWSGLVRNAGISVANGDIITYLDIDDFFGTEHLQIINDNYGQYDWVWWDDKRWGGKEWVINPCKLERGKCGTSNVAHSKNIAAYWRNSTYLHDYVFINQLMSLSKNYMKIPPCEYMVAHVPSKYDI